MQSVTFGSVCKKMEVSGQANEDLKLRVKKKRKKEKRTPFWMFDIVNMLLAEWVTVGELYILAVKLC